MILAWLGLVACSRPPVFTLGVGEELPGEVFRCNSLEGPIRDWCVVQALDPRFGTGREVYRLCRRMADPLARDRCLDLAVRHPDEPAPPEVCAYVEDSRLRGACWVSAALQSDDASIAFDRCRVATELVASCVNQVIAARARRWLSEGPEVVGPDVARAIKVNVPLAYDASFGGWVGAEVHRLGPTFSRSDACARFPAGSARLACEVAMVRGGAG